MVGMGSIEHLDELVNKTSGYCTCENEYRNALWNASSSSYRFKDNVYVKFGDQHGQLTVGHNFAGRNRFGPELMFGWTLGDALADSDEIVLLIKTAWGGKSLAIDFRPPSAGIGNYSGVRPVYYGWLYRQMITDILSALDGLGDVVPEYDGHYELAGFVWFQGWNDMLSMDKVDEYGYNLVHLIIDVRADLDAPHLPFLVGELGMHGDGLLPARAEARILGMRAQQEGVTLLAPLVGDTLFVRTAPYAIVDGSDNSAAKYGGIEHYWGRADTYFHIGQAFGRAALQLMANDSFD